MDDERRADSTGEPPEGFLRIEHAGGRAWVRAELSGALERAGLLEPGGLSRHLPIRDTYQGRGSTAIVELDGAVLVVRRFLPGGLLRRWRRPSFRRWRRPFDELLLMVHLRSLGLRTLEPIAAVARRVAGGYELELVTRRLEGAVELLQFLNIENERSRKRRILEAAGAELARFHEAGLDHADLHLKNFLVAKEQVYLIDLDRSRHVPRLSRRARVRNLARLWRYAERRMRFSILSKVSSRDVLAFLRGYASDAVERHAWFEAVRSRHARTRPLHAIGWLMTGRPPEPNRVVPEVT